MKLKCVMEDAGIEGGIRFPKQNFRDTLIYAEHQDIKLVELREVREDDQDFKRTLEIEILNIPMKIILLRTTITNINFGSKVITGEEKIIALNYAYLHDANGREIPFSLYSFELIRTKKKRIGKSYRRGRCNTGIGYKQFAVSIAFQLRTQN